MWEEWKWSSTRHHKRKSQKRNEESIGHFQDNKEAKHAPKYSPEQSGHVQSIYQSAYLFPLTLSPALIHSEKVMENKAHLHSNSRQSDSPCLCGNPFNHIIVMKWNRESQARITKTCKTFCWLHMQFKIITSWILVGNRKWATRLNLDSYQKSIARIICVFILNPDGQIRAA